MSQDTFPFAEGEEAVPFVDEVGGNRKPVLIAGGVVAALVLAVGGWFVLSGGDDATPVAFVPHKTVRPVVAAPKTVAKPAKKLPIAYKAPLGRDPFKALYVVPVAPPPAVGVVGTTTPGTTGTTPTSTGTGTTPTGTGTGTTARYPLKLVSISTAKPGEVRFYTWLVDGKKTTVIPAQRFGKVGELVVLAFETDSAGKAVGAIIQVGDDSPVDVLLGETISVL